MTSSRIDDENSPWRPDADVEFDHPVIAPFGPIDPPSTAAREKGESGLTESGVDERVGVHRPQAAESPADPPRLSRARSSVVLGVVLVVAVATVGVMVRFGPEPVDGQFAAAPSDATESGGRQPDAPIGVDERPRIMSTQRVCETARLPTTSSDRWLGPVPGAVESVGPLVAGSGGVAALTLDADGGQRLGFYEAEDGSERWSVESPTVSVGRRVVAVVGGVVLLDVGSADGAQTSVSAFDASTGFQAWTQDLGADPGFALDEPSASIVLSFEDPSGDRPGLVGVVDVGTGALRSIGTGVFESIDFDGRLVTVADDQILASTPPAAEEELLGVVESSGAPFAVVGSTVVMPADDRGGAFFVSGRAAGGSSAIRLVEIGGRDTIPVGMISSITTVSDTSLVVTSNGAVIGVELVDDRFEARWSVDGVLLAVGPSDRGSTLLVSREGGAAQSLVDAATGAEFLTAPTVFGGLDERSLFSNGVLVNGGTGAAESRTAYDLDGRRLWTIPGRAELAVGDGVAYEWAVRTGTANEPPTTTVSIRAIGDGSTGRACAEGVDPSIEADS